MILSGHTKLEIQKIIKDNTFEGVAAKLRFTGWKKINERSISKTI